MGRWGFSQGIVDQMQVRARAFGVCGINASHKCDIHLCKGGSNSNDRIDEINDKTDEIE